MIIEEESNYLRYDLIEKNSKKFFYPSSKKLYRDYQFNIIKTCLQTNTLVCLPTGLGKTMIASIIMYNFHKWFEGKIFFFAPTKPLISQQKISFIKLFPSLKNIVIEINGLISNKKREELYIEKKIFFLTPQTLDNDLKLFLIQKEKISLLIFDEAHKAQKNYAYTTIINKLYEQNSKNKFRIIGLSASPGSSNESIQNIINNLHIKQIEFRTEKDSDIIPFIFNKNINIIEIESNINISKIEYLINCLIENRLIVMKKYKIINEKINAKYLFVNKLLHYHKIFKEKIKDYEHEIGPNMICEIYQCFSLLFQLLSCKKKLVTEGLESFKNGIKKIDCNSFSLNKNNFEYSTAKKNLINSPEFQEIKNEIIKSQNSENSNLLDKTHPKLIKLKSILINQLNLIKTQNSKIIIFSEYKDTTYEIQKYLLSQKELNELSFSVFTGQNKNFKQKEQINIMNKFIEGKINILIATSIAEEGLDIGEVDLIICYDFNSSSPIKLIQRFGRTGRKRNGNVIVLAMKGEEKSKYFRALNRMKNLYKDLSDIKNHFSNFDVNFEDKCNILIPKFWFENVIFFDLENNDDNINDNELWDSEENEIENIDDEKENIYSLDVKYNNYYNNKDLKKNRQTNILDFFKTNLTKMDYQNNSLINYCTHKNNIKKKINNNEELNIKKKLIKKSSKIDNATINKIINEDNYFSINYFSNNKLFYPDNESRKLLLSFKISKNKDENSKKFVITNEYISNMNSDSPIKIDNESLENLLKEFDSEKKNKENPNHK